MSLTYTSPEAFHKARAARRNAAISSLLFTLLAIAGVCIVLAFIVIRVLQESPPVITPLAAPPQDTPLVVQEQPIVEPQPEASAAAAQAPMQMITVSTPNNLSVPEVTLESNTFDMGIQTQGSGGLGIKGFASGIGNGTGIGNFFNVETTGDRFAYVVDFSGSNSAVQREAIMRELTKSMQDFSAGYYQIIGFSGPSWFLGDEITYNRKDNSALIKGGGGRNYRYKWEKIPDRGLVYKITDRSSGAEDIPQGDWLSQGNTRRTLRDLEKSMVWSAGTDYAIALETALQMDPKPDVIYFMTDGAHISKNKMTIEEVNEHYGKIIRDKGIQLICIGLISNKSVNALKGLAESSRGKLMQANEDGTSKLIEDFSK